MIEQGASFTARQTGRGPRDTVVGRVDPRSFLPVVVPREGASTTADIAEVSTQPGDVPNTAEWALLLVPVVICLALVLYAGLFLS